MSATLAKEDAALFAQVLLQVASVMHRQTPAFGDKSFSASSRWHSSTSFSASSRFALASASVSPCEMAAGTSSTKQVYPPSLAVENRSQFHTTGMPSDAACGNPSHEEFAPAETRLKSL